MKDKILKLIALAGLGYFIVNEIVPVLVEDFANGLGVTFKKARLRWGGITDPFSIKIEIELDVRNTNPIGGKITSFNGDLRLGKKDGYNLGKLSVEPFDLKANANNPVSLEVKVNMATASTEVIELIKKQDYFRKLWIEGTLISNFGAVPISQEVSIFYE